jgi:hypothetical protein
MFLGLLDPDPDALVRGMNRFRVRKLYGDSPLEIDLLIFSAKIDSAHYCL